ncbi:cytochrome P450 [Streptomyces sp. 7-21]|nr:cytochrome P450 [Streptomyces sp. 7-21]
MGGALLARDPAGLRQLYGRLRGSYGPVAPVTLDLGVPAWLALGYREVHRVTSSPGLFTRDWRLWRLRESLPDGWPPLAAIAHGQGSLLHAAGAAHEQRAEVLSAALESADLFAVRRRAEALADRLIDFFCARGEADLVTEYAAPLSVALLAGLCGFTEAELPGLLRDVPRYTSFTLDAPPGSAGPAGPAGSAAHAALSVLAAVERLVTAPPGPPPGSLAAAMLAHPSRPAPRRVRNDLVAAVLTGCQPLADWIAGTLRLMLSDDRFAASPASPAWRAGHTGARQGVAEAMGEVLWDDGPVQNWPVRFAVRDARLGGRTIPAGDMVLLSLGAAHHDPQVRRHGAVPTAGSRATFAFGHGEHRCPYPAQELAETVTRAGVEVLLDRLPDAEPAVPLTALTWRPSLWLRGLLTLPVRFAPSPAAGPGAPPFSPPR